MFSNGYLSLKILPNVNAKWVEKNFFKKECCYFIPSLKNPDRCGCGLLKNDHVVPLKHCYESPLIQGWTSAKHAIVEPSDVFGSVEFLGGSQLTPSKAQYIRLTDDTPPELILQLLLREWKLELPKLLISVRGGRTNFDLQPKLKRVFKKGLLRAASITGAWITNSGITAGVMKHVGDALADGSSINRKIVALGIVPWGMVQSRGQLKGCSESLKSYHAGTTPEGNFIVLNPNCTHFLLVDNGTKGRYGAEVLLRKTLEKYISEQKISNPGCGESYGVPLICMVLEGGRNTIRMVLESVTDSPPVPVVVCDGSGRAADLLAFVHGNVESDGTLCDMAKSQLLRTIQITFDVDLELADGILSELLLCVKRKELITVFRLGDGEFQELDHALLTALLTAQNASVHDQLALALQWDRVDIAQSFIFNGRKLPHESLERAMMEALIMDRVEFVDILLKNGINMKEFLTIPRLESLYNNTPTNDSTLKYLVSDVRKHVPMDYHYSLIDIGMVIDQLMGGAFRSTYLTRNFKMLHCQLAGGKSDQIRNLYREKTIYTPLHALARDFIAPHMRGDSPKESWRYPFNELLIWAILMKRQKMAKFMWERGEDAMAKALIAGKLYTAMAHEAADDDLDIEIYNELKGYAHEFKTLSLDLLDYCYKKDDDYTFTLLTYELNHWSNQTCLSLAVMANHKKFISHPACQTLLSDLWMGGLHMRKNTSLKILLGLMFPPYILRLDFKSKEQLQLQPQTADDHIKDDDLDESSGASHAASRDDRYSVKEELVPDDLIRKDSDSRTNRPRHSVFVNLSSRERKSPLRYGKRFYEFYAAPITKFWLHTLAYLAFLSFFTYVVLVKMDQISLSFQELYVISYIGLLACERCEEIVRNEAKNVRRKCSLFFEDMWNICDTIAICLFFLALLLRLIPSSHDVGRLLYCIDIVFWYIRILDVFSVNKHLGPYVTMMGKMVVDMLTFISILFVVLMSFGVANQAIRYPDERPSWNLLKDVFFQPYFMLYGEVFATDINPVCTTERPCPTGQWVAPIIMSVYLLVANILLLNLLIAVFNNTFQRVNAVSTQVWMFQRYRLITEHETMSLLPPPFIVISYFWMAFQCCFRFRSRKSSSPDRILKLILSDEDQENIRDSEEDVLAEFLVTIQKTKVNRNDECIRTIKSRVEDISLRVDDIKQRYLPSSSTIDRIDMRLQKIEQDFEDFTRQSGEYFESMRDLLYAMKQSTESKSSRSPSSETVPEDTEVSKFYRARHATDTSLPIIRRTYSEGGPDHPPIRRSTSRNHSEYTTITDDISALIGLGEKEVHFSVGDEDAIDFSKVTDEDFSESHAETLLEAEEMEGRALGGLICHRIKELPENEGFGELAHKVAVRLEKEDKGNDVAFSLSCDPKLLRQIKINQEDSV